MMFVFYGALEQFNRIGTNLIELQGRSHRNGHDEESCSHVHLLA